MIDNDRGKYGAGYKVLEMYAPDAQDRMQRIDIAVWYPSPDEAKPFRYIYGENQIATEIAVDGKRVSGRFPLIIYSHGATGSGLSLAFLAESLASEGFVVAAPDYTDRFYAARIRGPVPTQTMRQKVAMWLWIMDLRKYQLNKGGKAYRDKYLAYRPNQARATIDRLIDESRDSDSPFHNLINEDEVGLVGHSFGAWTSILVGGADPAYADKRVKAVVAMSGPVNAHVYEPQELGNIEVPIMFMFGEREPMVGRMSDRKLLYDLTNAPKFLVEIKGADHFDTFSGGIRREFNTVSEYVQRDPRRAAIVRHTMAFFKLYVRNENETEKQMRVKADPLVSYMKDFRDLKVLAEANKKTVEAIFSMDMET